MQSPHWPMNGHTPPPGLDPVSAALGRLEAGQQHILITVGRQEHAIQRIDDKVSAQGDQTRDLSRRVTSLETRPQPRWTLGDLKLTLGALVFLALVLLGKVELAQQVLSALAGK